MDNLNTMHFTVAFFLSCVVCGVYSSGTSLTFELADRNKFCISESFDGSKEHLMEYKVIRGGQNDIDVQVKSPNGKILYKKTQAKEGNFEFETSRGDFAFCFSNEFSTWAHKVIHFNLRPVDINSLAIEAGKSDPSAKTSAESSCDEIHEKMTSVVKFQRDYRLKESIGRHLADVLHSHVTWWALAQTVAILFAGLGQTFILKRFFTENTSHPLVQVET